MFDSVKFFFFKNGLVKRRVLKILACINLNITTRKVIMNGGKMRIAETRCERSGPVENGYDQMRGVGSGREVSGPDKKGQYQMRRARIV